MLKQNITRKGRIDKNVMELAKLDTGNNKNSKYQIEAICNSAIYTKKSTGHIPRLYYLVFKKNYLEKNDI